MCIDNARLTAAGGGTRTTLPSPVVTLASVSHRSLIQALLMTAAYAHA